jgi:hypothetical protein
LAELLRHSGLGKKRVQVRPIQGKPVGVTLSDSASKSTRTFIPKILRRYFLYDRRLLSELSRCAWDSLKVFFQTIVPEEDELIPSVLESDNSSKERRKNRARLIQKIGACPGLDPGRLIPSPVPNVPVP